MTLIAVLCFSVASIAQNAPQARQQRPDGARRNEASKNKERLQSEKIAFLTAELELTPEEAQVFWPVYNKAQEEQRQAGSALSKQRKAMQAAIQAGKDEKEIAGLLNAYVKGRKEKPDCMAKYAKEFQKVIGPVKTAKLYLAEEKFRQQQIHRLGGHNHKGQPGRPGGQGGQRPQRQDRN